MRQIDPRCSEGADISTGCLYISTLMESAVGDKLWAVIFLFSHVFPHQPAAHLSQSEHQWVHTSKGILIKTADISASSFTRVKAMCAIVQLKANTFMDAPFESRSTVTPSLKG